MTFSLVVRDGASFGMVICSSSPAVASRCVHLRAGVGGVASQNVTNPHLGAVALDALADQPDAGRALHVALATERHPEYRQLIVVDPTGDTAVHTGARALGIRHEATTKDAAAAGNMHRSEHVIDTLLAGFSDSTAAALEQRLLDGLTAAMKAGGEAGPVHSAGLQVTEDVPWPVTDLRVVELQRLWAIWQPQKADYRTRGLDPTGAPSYGVPGDL